ncbi:hypothetical protein ACOMHN_065048 [Nucella lapillus]
MARFLTALFLTLTLSAAQGQQSGLPQIALSFLGTNAVSTPSSSSSPSSPSSGGMNQGTLGSSVGGSLGAGLSGGNQQQGHCNYTEKHLLFNNCVMSFGMRHMGHFDYLRNRSTCDVTVFSCGQVDTMIRCVNSQPISDISNSCWTVMNETLTRFLDEYRLPCTYQDLKSNCLQTSADLLPIDQRQQHGQGMNTSPTAMINNVMRQIMPSIMKGMMGGGGGGFGALFGR